MPDYLVEWQIDVVAPDAESAAREAKRIMRARDFTADSFVVISDGGETEVVNLRHLDEAKALAGEVA